MKSVQHHQRQYESVVNTIDGIVYEADAQTFKFQFVSQQAEGVLGYPVERWLSEPDFWVDHIHPEDRDEVVSFYRQATTEKRLHQFKYRMIAADGRAVWVRDRVTLAEGDQRLLLRGLILDISETQRTEVERKVLSEIIQGVSLTSNLNALLQLFHEHLKRVLYAENCFVALHDPETGLFHKRFYVDKFNTNSSPQKMAKSCSAYVFRTGRPLLMTQVMLDEMLERGDVELVGERAPSWLGVPLKTPTETIGVLVVQHYEQENVYSQHDVSFLAAVGNQIAIAIQRKRAEDTLRESEERTRLIIDNALDAVITMDASGRIVGWNPQAEATFGWSQLEAVGQLLSDTIIPIKDRKADEHWFKHSLATGEGPILNRRIEVTALHRSGQEFPVELTVTQARLSNQVFLCAFIRDISERKQAEEALRQSQAWLTAIFDSSRDAILVDEEGRIVYSNKAAAEIFGHDDPEELIGKQTAELGDHRHTTAITERFRNGLGGDSFSLHEFKGARKDGGLVDVESSVSTAEIGDRTFTISVVRDVTERKRIQDELRDREMQLAEAQRMARLGSWEWDITTNQVSWSPELYEICGLASGQFDGTYEGFLKLVHPEDMNLVSGAINRAVNDHELADYQFRFMRPDGPELILHGRGRVILDERGHPVRMIGTAQDISEGKHAEEALRQADQRERQSEQRYRELVENAKDIIYTHDLTGLYTSLNKAGEQITGYTRDEVLKMNVTDMVVPECLDQARRLLSRKLAGDELTVYEVEILAKDGRRVPLEVNTRLIYKDGEAVGIQGIARDVSERLQLGEQLRQSQKLEAIGQLAGGVAHDFNNLLTVISGYSDMVLKRIRKDPILRPQIEEIRKAAARAASLTRQLLAFSRKQVLDPKVLDLNSIVADMDRLLRRLIGEDIELVAVCSESLGRVKADPGQLSQVIVNLVINSRDAMPNGGKITIETNTVKLDELYAANHVPVSAGEYVMLAISDTGEGMDRATQQQIFEPFFTTKAVGKGTGLGLSMVYGVVKQSGGYIWVYSELGVGTTFKIYLPLVHEKLEQTSRQVRELPKGTETVMLVEDEEPVRKLVKDILDNNGYTVLVAGSGEEALKVCEECKGPIQLLITDVVMPGMSGRELVEHLTKRPGLKVLYISGYPDDAIVRHGILEPGTNFLQKPFTPDDLVRKVHDVLSELTLEGFAA